MQQTETTISIIVKMENESKLNLVHFPRQNPMHIFALWVELYRWTKKKNSWNSGLGNWASGSLDI